MRPDEQNGTAPRRRRPLSPDRVRATEFNRTPLGRRGYDVDEVQLFLRQMAEEIAVSETEKARLRQEILRLQRWYRDHGTDVTARRAVSAAEVRAQAVTLLSEAQLPAEAYIAQAQAYSRRVAVEARQQAEPVLSDAQQRADTAAEAAAKDYRYHAGDHYAAELEEMERRLAWLRAFCHAIQVQLHAASDAFTAEVDKPADLPERPASPPPPPGQEADMFSADPRNRR
ncbi:MAG TPA: DivIVA domain-containing protein [Pseudonocardiaceae bacterium]|jgi:DivIVA domain-containing protein|nr:DivIVA domain-containing protein [Pseudonocardiaceae bacterium]